MLRRLTAVSSLIVLLVPTIGFAQEGEAQPVVQPPAVVQEGSTIVFASDDGGVIGSQVLSIGADSFSLPSLFNGEMVAQDEFSMLNNASVQKDLNLVDEQLKQIEEINAEYQRQLQEKLKELMGDDGKMTGAAGMTEFINEMQQNKEGRISSVLLPHQQDRLKQVARQMKIQNLGSEKALTRHLAEELGITPDQKQRIEQKAKQLKADLAKKIADLQANAKQQLLKELSKDQRNKLEELLGDEFVVKREDSKRGALQRMIRRHSKEASAGF